jgi:peptide/nickel transport system substrate-binding protein
LEQRIASSWGSWIVPADYITEVGNEAFAAKPIGTGPYKVVSYSPEKVVLERFDDYWGEKPAAKTIEYDYYPETSARMTALVTGEVDMITQLPLDQVPTVEANNDLSVKGLTLSNMHVLVYNTKSGPLADKKLRQALSLSIDRQMLADTLWQGKAIVPKGHQFMEFGDNYIDDYPTAEYNLEKAKQLLAESSYKGELIEYELKPNYYTFGSEAAEAIVDMWKQIGINAKVKFTEKVERQSVSNWSNTMRFPDPSGGLWLLWGPDAKDSTWPDMSQDYIQTGTELSSILDPAKRKDLARKLMTIWDEEAPGTVLYYPYESWGVRKGLDWTPYSSQAMDFRADNFKVQ